MRAKDYMTVKAAENYSSQSKVIVASFALMEMCPAHQFKKKEKAAVESQNSP